MRADIPAADIAAAGTATITVFSPTPGGGTSNPATFTIAYQAPVPTVTSISPSSGTAGSGNFQIVVTGTNFTTDSKVRWNGLDRNTTFVSSTEVRAAINAADVAAVGSASVTVYNAPPGGGTSANAIFTINNPLPTITGLTPNSALVGNSAVVLTVNGAYFVNGSVVTWNGANLTTTYSSATQLRATIPAANLTGSGRLQYCSGQCADRWGDVQCGAVFRWQSSPNHQHHQPDNSRAKRRGLHADGERHKILLRIHRSMGRPRQADDVCNQHAVDGRYPSDRSGHRRAGGHHGLQPGNRRRCFQRADTQREQSGTRHQQSVTGGSYCRRTWLDDDGHRFELRYRIESTMERHRPRDFLREPDAAESYDTTG